MPTDIIIRKQKFKINAASEEQAIALRRLLNDEWQYRLLHCLEQFAADVDLPPDATIYLDKIPVRLGTLRPDEVVDATLQELEIELHKQLARAIQEQTSHHTKSSDTHPPAAGDTKEDVSEEAALLHFLRRGYFPWWHSGSETPTVLLERCFAGNSERFLQKLGRLAANGGREALNLTERFLRNLPPALSDIVFSMLITANQNGSLGQSAARLRKAETTRRFCEAFALSETTYTRHVLAFLLRNKERQADILDAFLAYLREQAVGKPGTENSNSRSGEAQTNSSAKDVPPKGQSAFKEETLLPDEAGIYVGNAGLILLHPFLPSFFEAAGLLSEDKVFASTAAQHRGAVLLHCLQNFSDGYNEWEMPFEKILCGLAVDELLDEGIALTAQEKTECNELWATLVQHWEALRGASAEAVIETFIRRPGKISFRDSHWLLQVERNGTDILLDRLPWGFGVVHLPWLNALIYTEW